MRRSVDTAEQRLYDRLARHYVEERVWTVLEDGREVCRVAVEGDAELAAARSLAVQVLHDCDAPVQLLFHPAQLFSPADHARLKQMQTKLVQHAAELATLKTSLRVERDEEIDRLHKRHLDRLHRYNEAKDVAQALMGRLAQLSGCTTRELYPQFNLSLED